MEKAVQLVVAVVGDAFISKARLAMEAWAVKIDFKQGSAAKYTSKEKEG